MQLVLHLYMVAPEAIEAFTLCSALNSQNNRRVLFGGLIRSRASLIVMVDVLHMEECILLSTMSGVPSLIYAFRDIMARALIGDRYLYFR